MTNPMTADMIAKSPVISEKAYAQTAKGKYMFHCHPAATKVDIRRAIEEMFVDQKLKVVSVNTIRIHGKKKRRRTRGSGGRISDKTSDWKKAIVTLAAGQKIEGIFEGV